MTLLDPARISIRASLVLNELQQSETWKAALDKALVAASALFVRSLAPAVEARAGVAARLPDYYIVSVLRESGVSARFAHDAHTGELLEAEGVRKAGAVLKPYVDAAAIVRSRWPPAAPGLPDPLPPAEVVWQPCRQSTSRFAPFWRFHIEGQTVYVRADGELFTELTTTGRG
jgi:hypothetical protein